MTLDLSNLNSTSSSAMSHVPVTLTVSDFTTKLTLSYFFYRIQSVSLGPGSRVLMTSGSRYESERRELRSDDCVVIMAQ